VQAYYAVKANPAPEIVRTLYPGHRRRISGGVRRAREAAGGAFSGIIFDHVHYRIRAFQKGETEMSTVFGQTCDGMDTIAHSEVLPKLEIDDFVYSDNIGAYSNASSTWFNGFAPAKVVHVNE
jgi:diaminopimelate decarboxylase